jgi:hypothetical protein
MLPGLILTVGLISQSVASLVSTAPRDPATPRFVNIGDDIVQSSTARAVSPIAATTTASPPAAALEPQRVIADVRVKNDQDDEPEMAASEPAEEDVPADQLTGGVTFVPVVVRRTPRRAVAHAHPFTVRLSQAHTDNHPSRPTMMRPSFTTVMLPPFPTVLLPPAPAAQRPR